MSTIRVLRLRPGRAHEMVELTNSLEPLQREVGGYIEVLKVGDRLDIVVNEDGADDLLGQIGGVDIRGVALLVRKDPEGQLVDVTDDDVAVALARLAPAKSLN